MNYDFLKTLHQSPRGRGQVWKVIAVTILEREATSCKVFQPSVEVMPSRLIRTNEVRKNL